MTALGASIADLAATEVLPPDRRAAMYAVYAFCRIVDDVADEPGPRPGKISGLAAWRARIAALYAGHADDPVTRVLLRAVEAMAAKLAGHAMFQGAAAERLRMCGDCRVIDIHSSQAEVRITDL